MYALSREYSELGWKDVRYLTRPEIARTRRIKPHGALRYSGKISQEGGGDLKKRASSL